MWASLTTRSASSPAAGPALVHPGSLVVIEPSSEETADTVVEGGRAEQRRVGDPNFLAMWRRHRGAGPGGSLTPFVASIRALHARGARRQDGGSADGGGRCQVAASLSAPRGALGAEGLG